VRVTNVPQIGGRTLEYRLGSCNFLFIGRGELGTTLEEGSERRYRHFGGHFAQLHPEPKWHRAYSSYPANLFMGRYTARMVPAEGGAAAVEMTGPVDLATGTRVARRVELFPGTTRVRLTDTLTNVRPVPQEWGIHDLLQLKGFPTPSGILSGDEEPRGRLGLYVPLNPKSQYPGGARFVLRDERGARGARSQWSASRLPGLLVLRYRGQFSKVLVDPGVPWVAFVDHQAGCAFVQRCKVPGKAILTAGGLLGDYPFIEVQSFAPVVRLAPGKSTTLVQEWYAARCPGPVVDVTTVGVVSSPFTLLRDEDKTWAAGAFGVFCVGRAAIVFRKADGTELARLDCGPVHPLRAFALNRAVVLPPATAEVTLEVCDTDGGPLGHLGKILLGSE